MKKLLLAILLAACLAPAQAEKLVILHTNDTHSQIDTNAAGQGGYLQRKAVIDSVRRAEKNVFLVDAGDIVQGSLYFKFFRGDVEYPLHNMMGYDLRILGNHEFDNGMKDLAEKYRTVKAKALATNYDFTGTGLEGVFDPYLVKKIGGKKIGFMALNVDPEGLISKENYEGMKFRDIASTANETAAYLKDKLGCDLVVAVTHIGYDSDREGAMTDPLLAAQSKDIDIIIGGHSHTLLNPAAPKADEPYIVNNADGKPVLIAQTGSNGYYIGKIVIDTDNLSSPTYELIPVTDRFAQKDLDKRMASFLVPYKAQVDSINAHVIATSLYDLKRKEGNGGFANWTADFARWYGDLVADSVGGFNGRDRVDLALMNVGGIRLNMPKGDVTEGQILSTFPFSNRMTVIDILGKDLWDALEASAHKGGEAISENVRVVVGPDRKLQNVIIDNKPLDPDKHYLVATIDYLANGNDYLFTLANGKRVWTDNKEMSAPMLRYVYMLSDYGLPIAPDLNGRFIFK